MADYPLAEHDPLFRRRLDEITLDAVVSRQVKEEDLRVTPAALEAQARIAERAGRPQLAESLRRAAELVALPEDRILTVYNALRPGRASREQLLELAAELENRYRALRCAALVREAVAGI